VTAEEHVLFAERWGQGIRGERQFWEYPLTGSATLPRRFRPKLPHESHVLGIALSPRNDLVAWSLRRRRSPGPITLRLRHRFPWLASLLPASPERNERGLWVSRLDGGTARLIGSEPEPVLDFWEPSSLRWTPDGKRLSFRRRGLLYTVPAPD